MVAFVADPDRTPIEELAYLVLHPAAPFDRFSLLVSHCMLEGESDPPQASGLR